MSNSKKYDTLERLLYIYNHSLNNYKKTEEYKRLVALNLPIPDMLSVSSRLKEYKLGLRGIGLVEFVPDTILRLDRYYKYIIYCDLSLLTSDFLSDLSYYHKLVIVSNDFNLHDLSIHFPSVNTYLDSYIDLSSLRFILEKDIDYKVLCQLISYNLNLGFISTNFKVLGNYSGVSVEMYIKVLSELLNSNLKNICQHLPILGLNDISFLTFIFSNIPVSDKKVDLLPSRSKLDLSKLSSLVIGPVYLEIDNQSENISYNFSTVITAKGEIGVKDDFSYWSIQINTPYMIGGKYVK